MKKVCSEVWHIFTHEDPGTPLQMMTEPDCKVLSLWSVVLERLMLFLGAQTREVDARASGELYVCSRNVAHVNNTARVRNRKSSTRSMSNTYNKLKEKNHKT